ncbi:MAG TPA: PLP-dependent aminotransferase family protein [Caulobacteraceae bacterium]|nr:PLP-dependent aminotransferase family protein [Caulobacteraceae bacterium]
MSWSDIYPWRAPDRAGPVVRQIYGQVRGAILDGALGAGARLPSSRDLASRLGVARASVVSAYEQLVAEGYVETRPGAGAFVAADLSGVQEVRSDPAPHNATPPPAAPDRPAEIAEETPAPPLPGDAPFNSGRTLMDARALAAWGRAARRALKHLGPEHFGYAEPAGHPDLREAIAAYLRAARGVICEASQVIVTAGAQQAIDIVARVLIGPGAPVWVEDPAYPTTVRALTAAGAALRAIPVDKDGLVVAEGVARAPDARAAYVTASHQYPLGVTLSMARRLELLAWARAAGAWIIEDDYASEFRYAGPPLAALQGLDGGARVLYVGTLNKAVFPGLRLGYLVAPPALMPALLRARQLLDRQPPSLTQAIVLDFMQSGDFAAHVRRRRLAYRAQRDALSDALAAHCSPWLDPDPPEQGMHMIAYLKDDLSDLAAETAAGNAGVIARAISPLYLEAAPRQGLMLGFSGFPPPAMAPAARRLAAGLRSLAA